MRRDEFGEKLRARGTGARTLSVVAVALVLGPGFARAVDVAVEAGAVYETWNGSDGSRSSQFHVPLRFSGRAGDFAATLLNGYAQTTVDESRGTDSSMAALLDTKVGASYEVVGKLPVDLLVGLDFNLPTGKTDLNRDEFELSESLDPELLSITNLGEGFNVNPTLTLAKTWGSVGAGLGLGYLWRGSYDASEDLTDYDPGDVANVTAEVRWAFAPEWEGRILGNYSRYGRDTADGDDVFREGDFASLLLGVRRAVDRWGASLALQGIYRGKSELPEGSGGSLETEEENSHGMEYRGILAFHYAPTALTTLTASLRGLYIVENDYADSETRYVGDRRKISASLGGSHRFTPVLSGRLSVGGFWMADDERNLPRRKDAVIYRGVAAAGSLTASF